MQSIFESVAARNPGEAEFHQAVREVFESLEPAIKKNLGYPGDKIPERICEPERQIIFRASQMDDRETMQIDRDSRIKFSSTLGPCEGGLRFHPSVYPGITKFLGLEQIFKNSLIGSSIGGGRDGSDFNPHDRSNIEVMRFCQPFMTELYRHLGEYTDVPAGDIGAGGREIGYMFGQCKRITNRYESGALTGKGLDWDGSLIRIKATGYGVVAFTQGMLKTRDDVFDDKRVMTSGSGGVVIYAIERIQQFGGKVVAYSDSSGYVVDGADISIGLLKQVKKVERGRIVGYTSCCNNAELGGTGSIWDVVVDVTPPCTIQNGLNGEYTTTLIRNGVKAVIEGANMPTTPEDIHAFQGAGVLLAPGKAADAGSVVISSLEMQQNAMCDLWTFEYTEERLTSIMRNIHDMCAVTVKEYGAPGDYVVGVNITGFIKIVNTIQAFGLI